MTDVQHVMSDMANGVRSVKLDKADDIHHGRKETEPLVSEEQKFWTAVAEPPDIDYRWILEQDMEKIKHLKKAHFHFTERILRYQTVDVELERSLVSEYWAWAANKMDAEEESGNERQRKFLEGLLEELDVETEVVDEDYARSWNAFVARRSELSALRSANSSEAHKRAVAEAMEEMRLRDLEDATRLDDTDLGKAASAGVAKEDDSESEGSSYATANED